MTDTSTGDLFDEERTDSERLEHAMHECAIILRAAVGLQDPAANPDALTPRVQVDADPVVSLEAVSLSAFLAACNALQCLAFGLSVMDLDTPTIVTVEQGLAAITSEHGMPC